MIMLAGPNGAGKSTLYELVVAPRVRAPFINADMIQRDELNDRSMRAAYRAAEIAEARRQQALRRRTSFVSESTFSHPSKLALIEDARDAGFHVVIYHISVSEPALSVQRVAMRVGEGGHDVPPTKILERYERNPPLIRQAVLKADLAFVFDNSLLNRSPLHVLHLRLGKVVGVAPHVPEWAARLYAPELAVFETVPDAPRAS